VNNRNIFVWYILGDEIADYCIRVLSSKGLSVQPIRAHSAEEAVTAINSISDTCMGVILTNNTIPGNDLTAVVESLHTMNKRIIIVLSGSLNDQIESNLLQLGVKYVLCLPIKTEELYESILAS